ncbi:MAG TPA: pyruvate kinase [Thermoplasmata archaeon]|nr:pyruvate kinase [Thermoplasmata archaeon]
MPRPPSPASTSLKGDAAEISRLVHRLETLRQSLLDAEARVPLARFGQARESASNLVHYLALRQFDLRSLQNDLAELGLSSLGRAESHVLHNLESVLASLYALQGRPAPSRGATTPVNPRRARTRIDRNATFLFGAAPPGRSTRIMVTAPLEVATDPGFAVELLRSGMDCLRINCAHDSPNDWKTMIDRLHRAERSVGRPCRVEMDLGGPRLRTGPLEPGAAVLKVRPPRDDLGRVQGPALVELAPAKAGGPVGPGGGNRIVVPLAWLDRRSSGNRVRFRDARGARREFTLLSRALDVWTSSVARTSYLTNGLALEARSSSGRLDRCAVGGIDARPGRIRLAAGDPLLLSRSSEPGHDRRVGPRGRRELATISVTIPKVVGRMRPGERVWFDGGRFGGVVRSVSPAGALLLIDQAPSGGGWLRADQGVNLPDTDLGLPPLTDADLVDLAFVVQHADLVGYSFVQSAADVLRLREELRRVGRPGMGIVLKVETRRAFERLPEILLAALRTGPAAVMLARGDLAVEVGFDRLAEVQEEILWLAEAAHLPTIWATQVLEGLAKSGIPSRAEVTDAAMGERAECVMLNKGPYLVPAVRALDSIVRRMQAHQAKKSARLRHLSVAERFLRGTFPRAVDVLAEPPDVGTAGTPADRERAASSKRRRR